jgi:hypothetical protein
MQAPAGRGEFGSVDLTSCSVQRSGSFGARRMAIT